MDGSAATTALVVVSIADFALALAFVGYELFHRKSITKFNSIVLLMLLSLGIGAAAQASSNGRHLSNDPDGSILFDDIADIFISLPTCLYVYYVYLRSQGIFKSVYLKTALLKTFSMLACILGLAPYTLQLMIHLANEQMEKELRPIIIYASASGEFFMICLDIFYLYNFLIEIRGFEKTSGSSARREFYIVAKYGSITSVLSFTLFFYYVVVQFILNLSYETQTLCFSFLYWLLTLITGALFAMKVELDIFKNKLAAPKAKQMII